MGAMSSLELCSTIDPQEEPALEDVKTPDPSILDTDDEEGNSTGDAEEGSSSPDVTVNVQEP